MELRFLIALGDDRSLIKVLHSFLLDRGLGTFSAPFNRKVVLDQLIRRLQIHILNDFKIHPILTNLQMVVRPWIRDILISQILKIGHFYFTLFLDGHRIVIRDGTFLLGIEFLWNLLGCQNEWLWLILFIRILKVQIIRQNLYLTLIKNLNLDLVVLFNILSSVGRIRLFKIVLRLSRSISIWNNFYCLSGHIRQTLTRLSIRFIVAVELEGGGARLRTLFNDTKRWLAHMIQRSSARLSFKRWIYRYLLSQSRYLEFLGEVYILAFINFFHRFIIVVKDRQIPFVFLIFGDADRISDLGVSFHNPCIYRWGIFWDSVFSLQNSLSLFTTKAASIRFMLYPLETEQLRMHYLATCVWSLLFRCWGLLIVLWSLRSCFGQFWSAFRGLISHIVFYRHYILWSLAQYLFFSMVLSQLCPPLLELLYQFPCII